MRSAIYLLSHLDRMVKDFSLEKCALEIDKQAVLNNEIKSIFSFLTPDKNFKALVIILFCNRCHLVILPVKKKLHGTLKCL